MKILPRTSPGVRKLCDTLAAQTNTTTMTKPPKKPWRKTLSFSLSADLHDRLKKYTDAKSTNTSKLIQNLLEDYLKKQGTEDAR